MRGSPLLRAGLMLLVLLALLWPLHRLTSASSAPLALQRAQPRSSSSVRLTITSTTFPFRFAVSHLGKIIWEGESDGSSQSRELALPFPREGVDLLLRASWSEEKETAVRLEVSRAGSAPLAQTLWGETGVDDVVTFAPAP